MACSFQSVSTSQVAAAAERTADAAHAPSMELYRWNQGRRMLCVSSGRHFQDPETDNFPVWELRVGQEMLQRSSGSSQAPCGWSRSYKSAQTIFGPSPEGKLARDLLRKERTTLFGGVPDEIFSISSGDDLALRLAYGARHGMPQVFTYTVLDGGVVRFCEASTGLAHAAMSGAAEAIYGAGEFWMMHRRGRYWMCVSNNSGTYAPSLENLEATASLFRAIVGEDFEVEAIGFEDPKVKEYLAQGYFKGDPAHLQDPRGASKPPRTSCTNRCTGGPALVAATATRSATTPAVPPPVPVAAPAQPLSAASGIHRAFTHVRARSDPMVRYQVYSPGCPGSPRLF